ncbi:RICIN domain-containing protein [Kitasatospora aburaviensis]
MLSTAGKAFDDPASSTVPGTRLITWATHGGPNQQWQLSLNADGSYSMVNGASRLCAGLADGSTGAGTAVVQAACSGGDSQRWLLTPRGGGYTVANKVNGLLLTTASTADGSPVTLQAAGGTLLQLWQIA